MRVTLKIFLLFFITILSAYKCFGQECVFNPIKQYTTADKLSHNGVTSVFEDSNGLIWFATYDGLNKYDGYSFKQYRNTLENKLLLSNRVLSLNEDVNKKLWIGTEHGINLLDLNNDKISVVHTNIDSKQKVLIVKKIILSDNDSVLCLLENHTILHFDKHYKLIGTYQPKIFNSNQTNFRDIVKLSSTKYAITSSSGLLIFDLTTKDFQLFELKAIESCFGLLLYDKENLFVVKSHGIAHLRLSEKLEYVNTIFQDKRFKHISLDANKTLWLGAINGISKVKNFIPQKWNENLEICHLKSFDEIYVSSVSANIKKRCWVTTFNKGIYEFEVVNNSFNSYEKSFGSPHGIETNTIASMSKYDDNKVLITTYFGKISLFDAEKQKFLPLPFKAPPENTEFKGKMVQDSKGNIWFSPRGIQMGLFLKKHNEDEFKLIQSKKHKQFSNALIRQIVEDKHCCIWVSDRKDVFRVKFDEDENPIVESLNWITSYKPKFSLIRYIYADPLYDFVWLASEVNGLYRVDIGNDNKLNTLKIENYQNLPDNKDGLSSNYVSHIIRDVNNSMWIATDQGGICNVVNETSGPKFITYSEKDGLINNGVKRIECDAENNLWLSTNMGINKFITKTKEFRKYQKDDGLPFLQFEFSSIKTDNGTMLFGGREGFTYFKPEQIKKNSTIPSLIFGDFKLFNKTIKPGDSIDGRVILEKNLSLLSEIELEYDQNVFSIEVASLHFKSRDNHFIKYKLSPIDKDWVVNPSSNNIIHYNGLPPGDYVFEAMASNSDNVWSNPKKINIAITPYFLKTNLAYTIYGIIVLSVILTIAFLLIRYFRLQHKLEIETLEKKQESELSDAKLRFFTNISHEFRTPLTLINGPIEAFLKKFDKEKPIKNYLELVKRQSKKILQLVEQAHDFRKVEKDMLKLNIDKFNFSEFIIQLILDFNFLASKNQIKLTLEAPEQDVFLAADKSKIEKVLNNLINNAFKFSNRGGTISIKYSECNSQLSCTVKDTGIGIKSEDIPHVFERFFQSKKDHLSHYGGSGIGLAFSKKLVELHDGSLNVESIEGKGAAFTFNIPIGDLEKYNLKECKIEALIDEEVKNTNNVVINASGFDVPELEVEETLVGSRVFIVEDNAEMLLFLANVFSSHFNVKTFSNGKDCAQFLEQEWPDLIISDVMMPEMNGIELCEHVKANIKTSHIPLILLTAVLSMESKLKGLGVGADVYINKPFEVKYLVMRSVMLLKNRKILRERFQIDNRLALEKHHVNKYDEIFVDKLFKLVDDNLQNLDLDVNFLARELGISRSQFFEKVKALTNQTPYELLKTYRLKKAAKLLVKGDLQVSEVSLYVGFKSTPHFSRAFKDKYKVSPGKYKSKT
ncbi:ATP-binding protein [Flavivirga abyssicola]|uniref:hybrid sensor histidine kinase/response regulator transcription factor n=1 Tax=Flavivirga abyssicola TaxID=3063533 RepID=UPI0026DF600D|nr:ATP-binding protein [Flavivirga sp. MEBiC07777]WVK12521.1 ATP-binding protein [Flavivirga sp. MEBiC07777]